MHFTSLLNVAQYSTDKVRWHIRRADYQLKFIEEYSHIYTQGTRHVMIE